MSLKMHFFEIEKMFEWCRFHAFRLRLQRSSQIIDDAGNDQENDLEELIMDQEFRGRYQFSKVVGGYTWRNLGFIKAWF